MAKGVVRTPPKLELRPLPRHPSGFPRPQLPRWSGPASSRELIEIFKGFNTTDVALEFGLLTAEVGEVFTVWRKSLPDLGEALAEVFLYLTALAEMNGVDLGSEGARKIEKNTRRCD